MQWKLHVRKEKGLFNNKKNMRVSKKNYKIEAVATFTFTSALLFNRVHETLWQKE